MNQKYQISKISILPCASPAFSKVQLQLVKPNDIPKNRIYFEDEASLEDLVSKYNIKVIGGTYDTAGSIGLNCILSDEKTIHILTA